MLARESTGSPPGCTRTARSEKMKKYVACGLLLLGISTAIDGTNLSCPVDQLVLQVMQNSQRPHVAVHSWKEVCASGEALWPTEAACNGSNGANPCLSDRFVRSASDPAKWTLTITKGAVELLQFQVKGPPGLFILHGTRAQVRRALFAENMNKLWNPDTRFAILLTQHRLSVGRSDALEMLEYFWTHYLLNVNVFVLRIEGESRSFLYDIFTHFPYENSSTSYCGGGDLNPTLIGTWDAQSGMNLKGDASLYPAKIPDNLGGCALRYSAYFTDQQFTPTFRAPNGLLDAMLQLVSQGLNARLVPSGPPYLGATPMQSNGTFKEGLGDVQSGIADMAVGEIAMTKDRLQHFDMTGQVYRYDFWVWLKIPPKAITLAVPYVSLPTGLGVLALGAVGLSAALLVLRGRLLSKVGVGGRRAAASNGGGLWAFVSTVLEQPVTSASAPSSLIIRILLLSLLIQTIVLNTAVKSKVSASLSIPQEQIKRLSGLQELKPLVRDLKIGFEYELHMHSFLSRACEYENNNTPEMENCEHKFADCVYRLQESAHGKYALISDELKMLHYTDSLYEFFYRVEDKVFAQPSVWYMQRNHPLIPRIRKIISYVWASGFQERLFKSVRDTVLLHPRSTSNQNKRTHKLQLYQFVDVFYLLLAGYVVSFTSFCMECIAGFFSRRK